MNPSKHHLIAQQQRTGRDRAWTRFFLQSDYVFERVLNGKRIYEMHETSLKCLCANSLSLSSLFLTEGTLTMTDAEQKIEPRTKQQLAFVAT